MGLETNNELRRQTFSYYDWSVNKYGPSVIDFVWQKDNWALIKVKGHWHEWAIVCLNNDNKFYRFYPEYLDALTIPDELRALVFFMGIQHSYD